MVDYEAGRFWISVSSLLGSVLTALYVWRSNSRQEHKLLVSRAEKRLNKRIDTKKERLDKADEEKARRAAYTNRRLGEAADRLTRLEALIENMPTQKTITELTQQIAELAGMAKQLKEQFTIMQQHLLDRGA